LTHQYHAEQRRIQIISSLSSSGRFPASDVIRRLQPELTNVDGISLFMQPVKISPLKIVSAARNFNTAWRTWTRKELGHWVPRFMDKLRALPELRDGRERSAE